MDSDNIYIKKIEVICYLFRFPIGSNRLVKDGEPASTGYLNSEESQQTIKTT